MKGIIFQLLQALTERDHGETVWDAALERAGAGGAYTSLGNYSDAEFTGLVGALAAETDKSDDDVLRWLGREALPILARRHPTLFEPHTSTLPFLRTLNDIIHPEVRKLYPDAITPEFTFEQPAPDVLAIGYQSPRRMCAFAEGLIESAAAWYHESVAIEQPQCLHRGDQRCLLVCRFTKA